MKNILKSKLALALVAFMAVVSQASAEESGGFIGFGLGVNLSDYQVKLSPCSLDDKYCTTRQNDENISFSNSKKVGVSTSLVAGYKQMFNNYFGLRYYANFDYSNANFKMNSSHSTHDNTTNENNENYTDKLSGYALSIGANIDMLANFVATSKGSFGIFAGLNVGLRNWGGAITNYHSMHQFIMEKEAEQGYWLDYANLSKKNLNFFDIGLNVGLRGNVLNHHDIELFAKFPFLQDTIIKSKSAPFDAEFVAKQDFILGLRYIYVF